MGKNLRRETLSELIKSRRTRKPALFKPEAPAPDLIKELIDIARHAPNHHRTEPSTVLFDDAFANKEIRSFVW